MQSHFKKVLLLATALLLVAGEAYSESSDGSFIAIAPDEELCLGSEGYFLPLPDIDNFALGTRVHPADAFVLINSVINKTFGDECKFNGLLLKGEITEKTLPQLRLGLQLLEARRNSRSIGANTLWLDSPGGLISEAMKIGDVIAEKSMGAIVVLGGHCYSSCVFIYAAAKTRSGVGDVGIHRPFSSEVSAEPLMYSEYLQKYDALTPILKQYFAKYGVSPTLVDTMNVVPSDDIRILSREERDSYGLGFYNVAAKEHDKAMTIQVCGQEYYDMNIRFRELVESCRVRFGIAIDDNDEECWGLARQAYPSFMEQFDACKEKKLNTNSTGHKQ